MRLDTYVCKYKVPKLLKVRRGETISPLSLLLWAPYLVVEDMARCPKALDTLLAARCSPNELGSPERAPFSVAVGAMILSQWKSCLPTRLILTEHQMAETLRPVWRSNIACKQSPDLCCCTVLMLECGRLRNVLVRTWLNMGARLLWNSQPMMWR